MQLLSRSMLAGIATALSLGCSPVLSQNPALNKEEVRELAPQGDAYTLQVFDNSPTFSSAMAVNATGQLFGIREIVDETGTIFSQASFFADGTKTTELPLLEGFTNIEALALSDNGLVVGYASRTIGHKDGSLTAFVWNSATGKIVNLGAAAGDNSSHAQDISADGKRITGYSNGSTPPRLVPCVWTWNEAHETWDAQTLPVLHVYNPYIMSSSVIISPDGQRIAACITVEERPNNEFDSSLFVWEYRDLKWERAPVSDDQMFLKDMNNRGQIAATYTSPAGRRPCIVDMDGKLTPIELLAGDVSGEARGIDSQGIVVGFSDDPTGPSGGPQAFVYDHGKTMPLELPAGTQFSSAFGINDRGQIAGLLDVLDKKEPAISDTAKAAEQPPEDSARTLGFLWTPKNAKP